MKRFFAVVLALACLFSCASAQENAIVFKNEMPEKIEQAFASSGWEGWQCAAGAVASSNDTEDLYGLCAMVVMEKEGQAALCGLRYKEDGYKVDAIGDFALFPGAEYEVRMKDRHFVVRQEMENGQKVDLEWALIINPEAPKGEEGNWLLLSVIAYTGEEACIRIRTSHRDYKQLFEILPEAQVQRTEAVDSALRAYVLEDFKMADFPLNIEEMENQEDILSENMAMVECLGMELNLRKGRGTSTESLGKYDHGTLVEVIESDLEWSRVRIGETEGYMYNTYLIFGPESAFSFDMSEKPLPFGKTKEETALYASPGSGEKMRLAAGNVFHVLGYQGEWLHVCIPSKEGETPGWMMDIAGTYGYVKRDQVIMDKSALRLLGDPRF